MAELLGAATGARPEPRHPDPKTTVEGQAGAGAGRKRRAARAARDTAPLPPPTPDLQLRLDVVAFLTGYLVLLFVVPSNLVVAGIGFSVTPAALVGLMALGWWMSARLLPDSGLSNGFQPIHVPIALFGASIVASYAAAFSRPLLDSELRAADRGLFQAAVLAGLTLLVTDGVGSQHRLDRLLRRLVLGGGFLAVLGVLQFTTGFDLAPLLQIPGLELDWGLVSISNRSNFRRVVATAAHAIEFGTVLAMLFPLALHFALRDEHRPGWRRWWPVIAIAVAIPMSISRTAFLGLTAAALVLLPSWPRRRQLQSAVVVPAFALLMWLVIPGLIDTIHGLFLYLWSDTSIQARIEDYEIVGRLVAERPLLGRGFRTFIASDYPILDNQYLGALVEMGTVGLVVLLLLFLVGFFTARGARRRSLDPAVQDLSQSLAAGLAVAAVAFATFDVLSFPMVTGITFLLVGCVGAQWRMARSGGADRPPKAPLRPSGDEAFASDYLQLSGVAGKDDLDLMTLVRILLRRWYVVMLTLLLTTVAFFYADRHVEPSYDARATLLLTLPSTQEHPINPYLYFEGSLEGAAGAAKEMIASQEVASKLDEAGANALYRVEVTSNPPMLAVIAEGPDAEDSVHTARLVVEELRYQLEQRQLAAGALRESLIDSEVLNMPQATARMGRKVRVLVAVWALGLATSVGLAVVMESIMSSRRRSGPMPAFEAGDEGRHAVALGLPKPRVTSLEA